MWLYSTVSRASFTRIKGLAEGKAASTLGSGRPQLAGSGPINTIQGNLVLTGDEAQKVGWGARWCGVSEGSLEEAAGRLALEEEEVSPGRFGGAGPVSWYPAPVSSYIPLQSWKEGGILQVLSPGP